jgi:hypothetical protein
VKIAFAGEVNQWKRYPVISVPKIKIPPFIDGIVDKREWFSAAKISYLLDYYTGVKTEDKTFIYIAYDDEKFYVAFQFERPKNALMPRADIMEKDKGPGQDDVFEMLLDVEHKHSRCFNFGGNVKGYFWDGIGKPGVDKSWNGNWQYKARMTDFGWEGEISIPFKDFGIETPQIGTVWGADFVRNEKTPLDRLAVWSYRGKNWHKFYNFGHLIFSGETISFSIDEMNFFYDIFETNFRISNFSSDDKKIKYIFELRKAKEKLSNEFYPLIEDALTEEFGFAILAKEEQEIENALKQYQIIKKDEKEVIVEGDRTSFFPISIKSEPGDYLLLYKFFEGEKILMAGIIPFKIKIPLSINLESYPFSSKEIFYTIELKRVKERINQKTILEVQFLKGKNVIEEEKFQNISEKDYIEGKFKIKEIEGIYQIKAILKDGEKIISENQASIIIPEKPVWLGNKIGKNISVPKPWFPLKVEKNYCEVWGRKFLWKKNSIFPEIEIMGKNILSNPIDFVIKDEKGEKINLKNITFKFESNNGERAVFRFNASSENIALQTKHNIEFDGMDWIELEIIPEKNQKLSNIYLEIPIRKEFAELYTCGEPLYGGRITEELTGKIPEEKIGHKFTYASWLGNKEIGLQWFAENDKNWSLINKEKAIEMIPENERVILRINFIDHLVELKKPIKFYFGLIPTPTRPKPENWHNWHFFQFGGPFPRVTEKLKKEDPKNAIKFERLWKFIDEGGFEKNGISVVILFGSWTELFGYPGTFNEEKKKLLKEWVELCHKKNIKIILYTGWGVNVESPEWKDYGKEMVRLPLKNTGYGTYRQCPAGLYTDFFVYKCSELIKEFDIDGIFLDSTASLTECNSPHGCGWYDEDGSINYSFPILKTRGLFKRLYILFHEEGKKDGIIYSHQSPPPIMPVESFVDVRCGGELTQFYKGEFDEKYLDYFIAKLSGEPYGLFCELTNKNWMNPPVKVNEVLSIAIPLNVSVKSLNAFAPQDYSISGEPMPKIHKALQWIEAANSVYLPWWKNGKIISIKPEEKIISSLWIKKGEKALICISNLSNESKNLNVEINLNEIGLKEIGILDAINEEEIKSIKGKFNINVDGRRYRLLKIIPRIN